MAQLHTSSEIKSLGSALLSPPHNFPLDNWLVSPLHTSSCNTMVTSVHRWRIGTELTSHFVELTLDRTQIRTSFLIPWGFLVTHCIFACFHGDNYAWLCCRLLRTSCMDHHDWWSMSSHVTEEQGALCWRFSILKIPNAKGTILEFGWDLGQVGRTGFKTRCQATKWAQLKIHVLLYSILW